MAHNGRIKQSLAYWCLNATSWQWDVDRICEAAVTLGCGGVELVPPELWPVVRRHGLDMPLAHNGMPDPPFVKGVAGEIRAFLHSPFGAATAAAAQLRLAAEMALGKVPPGTRTDPGGILIELLPPRIRDHMPDRYCSSLA